MSLQFSGSVLCSTIIGTQVNISTGNTLVTITPTQAGIYEGCTVRLQDHGGNLSNPIALPFFLHDMGIASICFDPALTVPSSECLALVDLYTSLSGASRTNSNNRRSTTSVDNRFGINTVTISGQQHISELLLHRNDITLASDAVVA